MKRRYVTADVFTDQMFGGNPLAVVLDAEGLSTQQMQSIALEFNYSETTFVLPPKEAAHTAQVRIFTSRAEVPFAGHPNVGTAFLLAYQQRFPDAANIREFIFEEAAGLVPMKLLRHEGVVVGAELRAPEALSRRSNVTIETAANCLSLVPQDVSARVHAPCVVSVGLPFLVVELASRAALSRAQPNLAACSELFPLDGADGVFAYTQDAARSSANETVLHARMFAPADGVVEDPATGSATAATLSFLASLGRNVRPERHWRVHQGADMGRPSLLLGRTTQHGTENAVHVGGRCVAVMQGSFELKTLHT